MDLVGLVMLVLALALVGFLVWIIITYVPMPDLFQKLIIVVVVVVAVLYLLGVISGHAPTLTLHR